MTAPIPAGVRRVALRTAKVTGLSAAVLLAATGIAAATNDTVTYYGCVNLRTGVLRVIEPADGQHCITKPGLLQERQITWNERGPAGPIGPVGPAGPAGPAGSGVDNLADLDGAGCRAPDGSASHLDVRMGSDGTVTLVCSPQPAPTPTPTPSQTVAVLTDFVAEPALTVGQMDKRGGTVVLSPPPTADTFVAVVSAQPGTVQVVDGGVTVPAGQTSAPVMVNALAETGDAGVMLTASLSGVSRNAFVVVVQP